MVTVATAAPAYAVSPPTSPPASTWTVSAVGWEGTQAGGRTNLSTASNRYFELTFHVPADTTVSGAQVLVVFSPNGNGGNTDDNAGLKSRFADGQGGDWVLSKDDRTTPAQHRSYTWTHDGDLTGGTYGRTFRLEISFSSVSNTDVGTDSFVHVTSQSPSGPLASWRQLPDNNLFGEGFVLVKA